jgi:lipopolysaccharide/colanic/teichoic acid biosynthesis glycosyltransferase
MLQVRCWSKSLHKRTFDIIVSALILACTFFIGAIVCVFVRLTSKGPALFRQSRVGLNGRLFTVYKFRTMVEDHRNGPGLTRHGDRRLTSVGKILRKMKLDELPQFYNVLRGDMSLVGPRPKLPEYSVVSDWRYRPGITGLATLAFRHEEEMLRDIPSDELDSFYDSEIRPRKARLDRWYMRRASFVSDLTIIWRTASVCLAAGPMRQRTISRRPATRPAEWAGEHRSLGMALETESVD